MNAFTETFGQGCGLNADWSVCAWRLAGSPTNTGQGIYAMDNEDGTFSIVSRDFECDDGGIQILFTGTEEQAMAAALVHRAKGNSAISIGGDL